jgi:glycosyltransferase involved in cell wall biosynthesis
MFTSYAEWLSHDIRSRETNSDLNSPVRFSVITPIYEKTDPQYFSEARDSILSQTYAALEWVVVAQGAIPYRLKEILRALEMNSRCRIEWLPENLGVIGGMRRCLECSSGDYVVTLDGDDVLTPDALAIMADHIGRTGAAFLYSDEDYLVDGVPQTPYLRPDWDPVLLTANSFIWHLCAFRRDRAFELGVYTDPGANWCHDWDTALRFYNAGESVVHVPFVLHHWRTHAGSSTNKPDPESGSLKSQRHVLERQIATYEHPEYYRVEDFPLYRGAPEWWIRRLPVDPPAVDLVIAGRHEDRIVRAAGAAIARSKFPFRAVHVMGAELSTGARTRVSDVLAGAGGGTVATSPNASLSGIDHVLANSSAEFAVVCSEWFALEGDLWPWDCEKLFRLHPDVAVVAGRALAEDRTVLGGSEIFGFDGLCGCPDRGRPDWDAGYVAFALKQRCVSAPFSELFAARTEFLRRAVNQLPDAASWHGLGAWLGGIAAEEGVRVAFTPVMTATLSQTRPVWRHRMGADEAAAFVNRFRRWIPDSRWYALPFEWRAGRGYCFNLRSVSTPVTCAL